MKVCEKICMAPIRPIISWKKWTVTKSCGTFWTRVLNLYLFIECRYFMSSKQFDLEICLVAVIKQIKLEKKIECIIINNSCIIIIVDRNYRNHKLPNSNSIKVYI